MIYSDISHSYLFFLMLSVSQYIGLTTYWSVSIHWLKSIYLDVQLD